LNWKLKSPEYGEFQWLHSACNVNKINTSLTDKLSQVSFQVYCVYTLNFCPKTHQLVCRYNTKRTLLLILFPCILKVVSILHVEELLVLSSNRAVIKLWFTWSLDLHTRNKLVALWVHSLILIALWVNCSNYRQAFVIKILPRITPYTQFWWVQCLLFFIEKNNY